MARKVAIAGIASHWGQELARRLERDPRIERIVGIDSRPPAIELARTELIEVDLRDPALARLLPPTEIDTVVHCGILWYPEPQRPPRILHEINVVGTLQLLAACERTPTLERVVVRGSAAIYGCEPAGPSFFTEELAGTLPLRTRFQHEVSELERYFDSFAARHPQLSCSMLRFQPEIGPGLATPLVRYLTLPAVPVRLGFDPRLQLLHADDATGALEACVHSTVRGPVNVAPDGSISLSRLLRLLRRPALPLPGPLLGPTLEQLGKRLGAGTLHADGQRLLQFGRGIDNRRLREEVGYEPRYDAAAAARDFAAKTAGDRLGLPLHPGALAARLAGTGTGG